MNGSSLPRVRGRPVSAAASNPCRPGAVLRGNTLKDTSRQRHMRFLYRRSPNFSPPYELKVNPEIDLLLASSTYIAALLQACLPPKELASHVTQWELASLLDFFLLSDAPPRPTATSCVRLC
jgi:hypothetical protein